MRAEKKERTRSAVCLCQLRLHAVAWTNTIRRDVALNVSEQTSWMSVFIEQVHKFFKKMMNWILMVVTLWSLASTVAAVTLEERKRLKSGRWCWMSPYTFLMLRSELLKHMNRLASKRLWLTLARRILTRKQTLWVIPTAMLFCLSTISSDRVRRVSPLPSDEEIVSIASRPGKYRIRNESDHSEFSLNIAVNGSEGT